MNYPDDARTLALATAFHALVAHLHDRGAVDGPGFLGHVAAGAQRLVDSDQEIAANALRDLIEPMAGAMGYRSDVDGGH